MYSLELTDFYPYNNNGYYNVPKLCRSVIVRDKAMNIITYVENMKFNAHVKKVLPQFGNF